MVEIAKALARKPRILILDEATSALTAADVDQGLRRPEAAARRRAWRSSTSRTACTRSPSSPTTARCSATAATSRPIKAGTKTDNEVVEMMIGREYSHVFPPKPAPATSDKRAGARDPQPLLDRPAARHLARPSRAGEVVGLGGLDGQGQRELLLALFGVLRGVDRRGADRRQARPDQQPARRQGATACGMALIPEDRKTEGLMLPMSVRDNLSFAALDRLSRCGVIDRGAGAQGDRRDDPAPGIRTAGTDIPVGALSGGNQQKVVIAKWLMRQPRIILLNDPTRGIDVGTKQEIYQLLRNLADAGAAILFYSTDYDELVGCCDRVLVLYDGAIKRELAGAEITERALIGSALNIAGGARPAMRAGGDA